jgi:hypothetical protein
VERKMKIFKTIYSPPTSPMVIEIDNPYERAEWFINAMGNPPYTGGLELTEILVVGDGLFQTNQIIFNTRGAGNIIGQNNNVVTYLGLDYQSVSFVPWSNMIMTVSGVSYGLTRHLTVPKGTIRFTLVKNSGNAISSVQVILSKVNS